MPLISVDQDRLDVADLDNCCFPSIQQSRSLSIPQNNHGLRNAEPQAFCNVLTNLDEEEEDMSVMTIETAFQHINLQPPPYPPDFLSSTTAISSRGEKSETSLDPAKISLNEESNHSGSSSLFNAKSNMPEETLEIHNQSETVHNKEKGKLSAANPPSRQKDSRYTTQTYSDRGIVNSSLHRKLSLGHSVSTTASSGSHTHSGRGSKRTSFSSYGSRRSSSKAVAIYPQSKRKHGIHQEELNTPSQSCNSNDYIGEINTSNASEKQNRTSMRCDLKSQTTKYNIPSNKISDNVLSETRTSSPSVMTSRESEIDYSGIEAEIAHLSFELATTKSNLDRSNLIIRDHQKQALQFESLIEKLQREMNLLRRRLTAAGRQNMIQRMNKTRCVSSISGIDSCNPSATSDISQSNGKRATSNNNMDEISVTCLDRRKFQRDKNIEEGHTSASQSIHTLDKSTSDKDVCTAQYNIIDPNRQMHEKQTTNMDVDVDFETAIHVESQCNLPDVTPRHEVFAGDPFATVSGCGSADDLESLDQISAVLEHDLGKKGKLPNESPEIVSGWRGFFRRRQGSPCLTEHSVVFDNPPKSRIFGF